MDVEGIIFYIFFFFFAKIKDSSDFVSDTEKHK